MESKFHHLVSAQSQIPESGKPPAFAATIGPRSAWPAPLMVAYFPPLQAIRQACVDKIWMLTNTQSGMTCRAHCLPDMIYPARCCALLLFLYTWQQLAPLYLPNFLQEWHGLA
jgi:hypothetical protein